MEREDLNIVSEFLVMAATLLDIKAKMLLPKEVNEEGEEVDPRAELVSRLLEYKRYKILAEEMEDRESLCTIFFSADARPEFQQLLEKFRKEKREFIWFCPVNRIVRPEINAGIRPYTRLIDVEEGGRL